MSAQRSQFEHLAIELIYVIFEYLAPHDLLLAFKNLNQRITAILAQYPLCLPNNRYMSHELYLDYLTSIVPKHASQIIYLHLSERYAPHAIDLFYRELPLDTLTWPALKAVTIEDLPLGLLGVLLYDTALLSNIQSLSINIPYGHFYYSQYDKVADFAVVIPIFVELPNLRSLYLHMGTNFSSTYFIGLERASPQIVTHPNLHTLTINQCSRELLSKLLDSGHLPKLCRLSVCFYAEHDPHDEELMHPTPLKQIYVPELRYVKVELHEGVGWVFTFLEDLQRHGQLEHFNIYGYMISGVIVSDVPRVAELRQWLALSKSKMFTFRLNVVMRWFPECEESLNTFLNEYRQAMEDDSSSKSRTLTIRYPAMSLSGSVKISETVLEEDESSNSTRSSDLIVREPVDENCEEMEVFEMDYMRDELVKSTEAVSRWRRLWKITLEGDFPDDDGIVGGNIPHLLHIAQRSPHFRELHINSDLDFGRILSANAELGILLASQLEILYFTGEQANCSLLDLTRIIDTLFAHSSSPPCLKQLTFKVDAHPSSWLTVRHLVRGIEKILDRFPKLIRFNLHCQYTAAFQEKKYNLSELAPAWSVFSHLRRPWRMRNSYVYRHKPHKLEIWL